MKYLEGKVTKDKEDVTIRSSAAEYLTFVSTTGDNPTGIEVRYENENIWLTQKMMATLHGIDVRTVNAHIQKIFEDNELEESSTIRNFRTVQSKVEILDNLFLHEGVIDEFSKSGQ